MTKANKKAVDKMNKRIDLFRGINGKMYDRLSNHMQDAIEQNADPSYAGSPAKDRAIQTAHIWTVSGRQAQSRIMAPAFANYRQYGCGGIPKAVLVEVRANNEQAMIDTISEAFHHPERF